MSTRKPRKLARAVLATLTLLAACVDSSVDPNEPPTTVIVHLFNNDTGVLGEPIHVLAPEEGLPAAGLSRVIVGRCHSRCNTMPSFSSWRSVAAPSRAG